MTTPPPLRRCCDAFDKAQTAGTDNEGWAALVYRNYQHPGAALIGLGLPPIAFCPWCAAPIAETGETKGEHA